MHYRTPQHRAWSRAVIRAAAGQCQGAAHDPAKPRDGVRLFADHVLELSDGGAALDPRNGRALCGACHTRKTLERRAVRLRE